MDDTTGSLKDKKTEDEIIVTNYWKEVHKDISDILNNLSGLVIITHNSIEFKDIIVLLNKTRKNESLKLLYISLTRSSDYINLELKHNKIENKRITFIDCVSGYAFSKESQVHNCLYMDPPLNLEQMKKIIKIGIENCNPDMVVIDSLSQFINFSRPSKLEISNLYKFLGSIKNESLNAIQDTFILLYDNKLGIMQNLPKMHTNMILKIEILKEDYNWRQMSR